MKYLLDTNIFLEILLSQAKEKACENFIQQNALACAFTDFILHSIGVITLKQKKPVLFDRFCNDVLQNVPLLSLLVANYESLINFYQQYNLDFDDSYQFAIAQVHQLTIVTMDSDFKKIQHVLPVMFL